MNTMYMRWGRHAHDLNIFKLKKQYYGANKKRELIFLLPLPPGISTFPILFMKLKILTSSNMLRLRSKRRMEKTF